jgi:hypothetical protein
LRRVAGTLAVVLALLIAVVSAWAALACGIACPRRDGCAALPPPVHAARPAAAAALSPALAPPGAGRLGGGVRRRARLVEHTITPPRDADWAADVAAARSPGHRRRHADPDQRARLRMAQRRRLHRALDHAHDDLTKLRTLDLFMSYWAGPRSPTPS